MDSTGPSKIPAEITLDVVEKFCPLQTDTSDDWRATLKEIQQAFRECPEDQERLSCVLTQSVVPEWPERPDGPYPYEVLGMDPIAMGDGPSRWPQQLFVRTAGESETIVSELEPMSNKCYRLKMLDISSKLKIDDAEFSPFVGEFAVQNNTGKPILYSDGQPVAMRRGINRHYFVHAGGEPHHRITSITSFFSLASRAGQCLLQMPPEANRRLWRDWLDGFPVIGDKGMWISALFELAWQQDPGSSLSATSYIWSGAKSIPLESIPTSRQPAEEVESGGDALEDSPAYWYSVIEDLVAASIAAVDILLAEDDAEGSGADR